MDRNKKVLQHIDLSDEGLEIGPLCWPILNKSEARIHYVDHVSHAGLIDIYQNDPSVPSELIAPVDFALNGRSLRQTLPKNKLYGYVIASHVIEHVPDMIRWLQDISTVLEVGGVLSLAIPDKRYTFDIDRQISTPADVIGAYFDKLTLPSATMIFDDASNARDQLDAKKVWAGELYLDSRAPHRHTVRGAFELCLDGQKQYVDTHCFVFTPQSFFTILRVLAELDLLNFEIVSFDDTEPGNYEFLVSLRRVEPSFGIAKKLATIPSIEPEPHTRELHATIDRQNFDIAGLRASLAETQKQLDLILASKSWQVTRPIRKATKLARKLRKT